MFIINIGVDTETKNRFKISLQCNKEVLYSWYEFLCTYFFFKKPEKEYRWRELELDIHRSGYCSRRGRDRSKKTLRNNSTHM
jgi:hypothetical protein